MNRKQATGGAVSRTTLLVWLSTTVVLAVLAASITLTLVRRTKDLEPTDEFAVTAIEPAPSRAQSYADAVRSAKPLDYFPLHEESPAADSAARYHDVRLAAVEGPFGAESAAASFAQSPDEKPVRPRYVELPQRDSLLEGRALTASLWFQSAGPGVLYGASKLPLLEDLEFGLEPALYVGTDGLLHAGYYDSGVPGLPVRSMTSAARVDDGRWHHAALTKSADGRDEVLYLDGVRSAARRLKGSPSYLVPSYVYLGAGKWTHWDAVSGDVGFLAGSISDFAYFDRVLSPQEIAAQYAAAKA